MAEKQWGEGKIEQQTAIVYLDNAKCQIEQAKTVQDVKLIRDKAKVLEDLAKRQNLSLTIQNDIAEIRLHAERKAGEILKETINHEGGRPPEKPLHDDRVILSNLGITWRDSSNWQTISELPKEKFEVYIIETKEKKKELTTKGILDISKSYLREQNKINLSQNGENIKITDENIVFRLGDFRKVLKDIEENSVDLILTDPPYGYNYIELWSSLSKFANRVLKPSGFCITYTGQRYLPEVIQRLNENLEYYWIFCLINKQSAIIHDTNVMNKWKAILLYQKKPRKRIDRVMQDYIGDDPKEKSLHDWQQGLFAFKKFIEIFSPIEGTVVDPFVGVGTTIVAAHQLKRKFIGSEIDKQSYNITKARVTNE